LWLSTNGALRRGEYGTNPFSVAAQHTCDSCVLLHGSPRGSAKRSPGGELAYRGSDPANNYFDLALTQTGARVNGRIQFCLASACGFGPVSGVYADSSVTLSWSFAYPYLTVRWIAPDTLIGAWTNMADNLQPVTDTLVFVRSTSANRAGP